MSGYNTIPEAVGGDGASKSEQGRFPTWAKAAVAIAGTALLAVVSLHTGMFGKQNQEKTVTYPGNETALDHLPKYLVALNASDPEYEEYEHLLTSRYVIGEEGKGNMIPGEVAIVRFTEPSYVYRVYGGEGKASQCGYWWTLDAPTGKPDKYEEHFAVCPSWNDVSQIVRCAVPEGYVAPVGIGQTVDCPNGNHLEPLNSVLQMNGNVCADVVVMSNHLACSYCDANKFNLGRSECSNTDANYIDGNDFGIEH